jgi:hypothetical protein
VTVCSNCQEKELKNGKLSQSWIMVRTASSSMRQDSISILNENYGRSRKGTPAKGIVPTTKGISITILGAISQAGVIDISLKKPQAVAISKKRKTNDAQAMVVSGRVGTRTEPFLTYISNVMDVLEEGTLSINGQCSYTHSCQGT